MNIFKFLLSRAYRKKFRAEYTKEFSNKLYMEQKAQYDLYGVSL